MTAARPAAIRARSAPSKSRGGGIARAAASIASGARARFAAAISSALVARIRARMSAIARSAAQPFAAPSFCVIATNCSSFFFAAPEAIAARALSMPSPIELATSAA